MEQTINDYPLLPLRSDAALADPANQLSFDQGFSVSDALFNNCGVKARVLRGEDSGKSRVKLWFRNSVSVNSGSAKSGSAKSVSAMVK
jgi:hypothetical protein